MDDMNRRLLKLRSVFALMRFCAAALFAAGTVRANVRTNCANGASSGIRFVNDFSGSTATKVSTLLHSFAGVSNGCGFTMNAIQSSVHDDLFTGSSSISDSIPGAGGTITKTLLCDQDTTMTIHSSLNPEVYGQSVTFTMRVASTDTRGTPEDWL